MNAENVGRLIRKKRLEKNLTQKELADRLNITDKAVSQWERGKCYPDICILNDVAKALEIPISDFFCDEEKEENVNNIVQETLNYANEKIKEKNRKIKIITGFFFASPIIIGLFLTIILAKLIPAYGDRESVVTMGFLLLALWTYIIKIGLPIFGGYIMLLWQQSRFMNKGWKKILKNIISFTGIIIAIIWLYESIRVIIIKS